MIRKIRKLIPNSLINYGKHLPEAVLASLYFGFPGKSLKVIGVTGTDGKTTSVNMIYHILKTAGKKVSMISTINAVVGGERFDTGFHVTSPEAKDIQRYINLAKLAGDEYLVLEVTSHALAQFRVWGIPFIAGLITNITHEHLDYHKTFDSYLKTKLRLLQQSKIAIFSTQVEDLLKQRGGVKSWLSQKVVTFGLEKSADINLDNTPVKLSIRGEYNKINGLGAAALCLELGIDKAVVIKALHSFSSLTGRMEEIPTRKKFRVVVDFAHTPNALSQALTSLRAEKPNRLIAVFGAASERDQSKRPLMGEVAMSLADITVLTSEDPRFEDPLKIINEIADGGKGWIEDKTLFKKVNRAEAIKLALDLAKPGDIIGIFGKGHEQSMNIKGVEYPWSDQGVVKKILDETR